MRLSMRLPLVRRIVLVCLFVLLMLLFGGLIRSANAAPALPAGASPDTLYVRYAKGTIIQQGKVPLPNSVKSSVVSMHPLFTASLSKLHRLQAQGQQKTGGSLPDLSLWYELRLRPGSDPLAVMAVLRKHPDVDLVEHAPTAAPPPATTPLFIETQDYLDAATPGINARAMWAAGIDGSGITIYDVEYSWNQSHEDLDAASAVVPLVNSGDTAIDPFADNNHGTAVLGELIATNDALGVTGIAYGADIGLAPPNTANLAYNPANAILLAAAAASPGDVILIEQQNPVCGTANFGPLEWLSSVYDATQTAVANGIVVVAAAGNGGVNLDDAGCLDQFNRALNDSGAIIVGAGGAPLGFDRQTLGFSSYGSRVDVQGWGEWVVTTGYGIHYVDPDNTTDTNKWYTFDFGGTSSASPIIAGAAALIQDYAITNYGAPLSPAQVRTILTNVGSPQQGGGHIGSRPDLGAIMVQRTLTVAGGGIGSGTMALSPAISCTSTAAVTTGDCGETIFTGAEFDIVATPDVGSFFGGWLGCDSTSTTTLSGDTCHITMMADSTVTARFHGPSLLQNGSFEVATGYLPDFWKKKTLNLSATVDGQDCAFASELLCSMRFKADANASKLTQTLLVSGVAGDAYILAFDAMSESTLR